MYSQPNHIDAWVYHWILPQFTFRAFTRLRQLQHLIDEGQIDDRFLWTRP